MYYIHITLFYCYKMVQRLIYLKIFKNAGTSLVNLFFNAYGKEAVLHVGYKDALHGEYQGPINMDYDFGHIKVIVLYSPQRTLEFIDKHPDIWHNTYKFSIIRNPYHKAVSGWNYCYKMNIHKGIPFHKTLEDLLRDPPTIQHSYHDFHHFTIRQIDFLWFDNKIVADKLIHQENLEEELEAFFQEIDWTEINEYEVPHLNSNKCNYDRYLTPEVITLINDHFCGDFRYLDYDKIEND